MLFLLVLKWKLSEKAFSNVKTKTNSNFAAKATERSNHSFLLAIWWTSFSDICTIMELKELNWLCKHMKNVRSSQPCFSMNICTEFSKTQVFPCVYREGDEDAMKVLFLLSPCTVLGYVIASIFSLPPRSFNDCFNGSSLIQVRKQIG